MLCITRYVDYILANYSNYNSSLYSLSAVHMTTCSFSTVHATTCSLSTAHATTCSLSAVHATTCSLGKALRLLLGRLRPFVRCGRRSRNDRVISVGDGIGDNTLRR